MISGSPDSLNQPGWERGLQSAQCKRRRSEQVPSASSCQWNSPFLQFEPLSLFFQSLSWMERHGFVKVNLFIIIIKIEMLQFCAAFHYGKFIYICFLLHFDFLASNLLLLMAQYLLSVHTVWIIGPNDRCYEETHYKQA